MLTGRRNKTGMRSGKRHVSQLFKGSNNSDSKILRSILNLKFVTHLRAGKVPAILRAVRYSEVSPIISFRWDISDHTINIAVTKTYTSSAAAHIPAMASQMFFFLLNLLLKEF